MNEDWDNRIIEVSLKNNTIHDLSNRNDEYCILLTITIFSITNETIPTWFTIQSSIVANQDKMPIYWYIWSKYIHYGLNKTVISTKESRSDENAKYSIFTAIRAYKLSIIYE